jgi:hypothetical protein
MAAGLLEEKEEIYYRLYRGGAGSTMVAELASRITDVRDDARRLIRRGIKVASKLSDSARKHVADLVVEAFDKDGSAINVKLLAQENGLAVSEAQDVAVTLVSIVSLLTDIDASVADFIQQGRGQLFDEEDIPTAEFFAQFVIERRSQLDSSFKRGQLAVETLPSLAAFNVSVDLRLDFEKDEIMEGVPVAIVNIRTDSKTEIWLQLSRGGVDMIVSKLSDIATQLKKAEEFFEKAGRRKGK